MIATWLMWTVGVAILLVSAYLVTSALWFLATTDLASCGTL